MKTILFPTDFSKASEKALKYAIEIARRSGAKITVTNAYIIPVMNLDVPPIMLERIYEEEKAFSESELIKTCEKISAQKSLSGKPLQCEFIAKHSLPVTEIAEVAKKTKADLIVMGTSAKEDTLSLIGSTTVGIINKGYCPVLVVHEESRFEDIRHIQFAVENVREEIREVIQLIELASVFDAEITILHIDDISNIGDFMKVREEQKNSEELSEMAGRYSHYPKIKFKEILSDNVTEALDAYLHKHRSDLLVLLRHERGWLENLFHKSVIKSLIKKEELPILILNKSNEDH